MLYFYMVGFAKDELLFYHHKTVGDGSMRYYIEQNRGTPCELSLTSHINDIPISLEDFGNYQNRNNSQYGCDMSFKGRDFDERLAKVYSIDASQWEVITDHLEYLLTIYCERCS